MSLLFATHAAYHEFGTAGSMICHICIADGAESDPMLMLLTTWMVLDVCVCVMQPPPTRRRKSRRNSTRSLRNAPGPLTRQLSAGSMGGGAHTPAQTTPRVPRRQMSEGSLSGSDTASLASGDSGTRLPHLPTPLETCTVICCQSLRWGPNLTSQSCQTRSRCDTIVHM